MITSTALFLLSTLVLLVIHTPIILLIGKKQAAQKDNFR